MKPKLLTIKKASDILGVSMMTLRRWDKSGKLSALRLGGKKSHRLYRLEDLETLTTDLFSIAKRWASGTVGAEPSAEFHCQNSSI